MWTGNFLSLSIYIYIHVCNPHCTYRNAVHGSNLACVLSRSPTMLSISLIGRAQRARTSELNGNFVCMYVCMYHTVR